MIADLMGSQPLSLAVVAALAWGGLLWSRRRRRS